MLLSETNQRRSRNELKTLISQINKTKKETRRTPILRFRAAVRAVINNLRWLSEADDLEKPKTSAPHLPIAIKGLLKTPVQERSEKDRKFVFRLIGHLKCLQRYPENVRSNIAASAVFTYFPPGRVLVREGYPSVAMYFIISGTAVESHMEYDAGEEKVISMKVAQMTSGDSFGEINILHDEPWPTTVSTVTHMELLTVSKEDFRAILEVFLGEQKRQVTKYLNELYYFKDWKNRAVVECCILARIETYPKDALIIGDNVGSLRNAYFVLSGECMVVYHLQLEVIDRGYYNEIKLLQPEEKQPVKTGLLSDTLRGIPRHRIRKYRQPYIAGAVAEKMAQQIIDQLPIKEDKAEEEPFYAESHFLKVGTLMRGSCFGVGESLQDKFILSNSDPVTVLAIPRHFVLLQNHANIWGRIQAFLNRHYPDQSQILKQFVVDRKWQRFRKCYTEEILKPGRPFTGMTASEAPYFFKINQDYNNPNYNRVKKRYRKVKTSSTNG